MSRAFVKDESWEDPVVAPRAALPDGVPNYVTPRGLERLREELAELETHRLAIEADSSHDDGERRRKRLGVLSTRLRDLAARIATAEVIDPAKAAPGTVRFGAKVRLRTMSGAAKGEERHLEIVGVDEAEPDEGRIAFVAPIARAILGKRVGQTAALHAAGGDETLRIEAIEYPAPAAER
jgi:transcription elongation factor GreB